MASIEGGNNGVSGIGGSGPGGAGSDGISASEMANNLVNASTGPAGLETDRLAASVDMAMQDLSRGMLQGTGLTEGFSAADLETAVMAQLGPRQQGQFQSQLDTYRASPFTTPAQQLAVSSPFNLAHTDPYNAVGTNAEGQAINSCGHVIDDLPTQTFAGPADTPELRFAAAQREQRQQAWDNIGRITSGPFSGLAASIAVAAGADQRTIELAHGLGQTLDGMTAHMGPSPWEAMRP